MIETLKIAAENSALPDMGSLHAGVFRRVFERQSPIAIPLIFAA
jgi:hypothetical protein